MNGSHEVVKSRDRDGAWRGFAIGYGGLQWVAGFNHGVSRFRLSPFHYRRLTVTQLMYICQAQSSGRVWRVEGRGQKGPETVAEQHGTAPPLIARGIGDSPLPSGEARSKSRPTLIVCGRIGFFFLPSVL